jgi:hypothetical protein
MVGPFQTLWGQQLRLGAQTVHFLHGRDHNRSAGGEYRTEAKTLLTEPRLTPRVDANGTAPVKVER